MAKLIRTNGIVETITPENGTNFTEEELKNYVGGEAQIINIPNDYKYLICNLNGKALNLTENRQATDILYFNKGIESVIVGNVVTCDYDQLLLNH
jgi:hypothetical protein